MPAPSRFKAASFPWKPDCRLAGKLCMKSGYLLMFTCVGCKNSAAHSAFMQNCKWISSRWIKEGKTEPRVSSNRDDRLMLQHFRLSDESCALLQSVIFIRTLPQMYLCQTELNHQRKGSCNGSTHLGPKDDCSWSIDDGHITDHFIVCRIKQSHNSHHHLHS